MNKPVFLILSFLLQKEFLDECIFNEMIEQSHYNTYSSARYSNHRRTMYLALNRRGQPRKVQIRAQQQLGKLSTYTRVLTQSVNPERVEELISRLAAAQAHSHSDNGTAHPLRHHGHLCAAAAPQKHPADQPGVDRLRCRRRKKRKKKRRKCTDEKDSTCPNKPFAPTKRKCPDVSPANLKGNVSSHEVECTDKPRKRKCSVDEDIPCPPKKNTTKCEKDECQRIPNNKLVSKKNNKKNRFAQNVQLRVNKKKNKKLKTKKVLNKNKAIEVTSSRVEVTTMTALEVRTEQAEVSSSSFTVTETELSSTTEQREAVLSEEDYSSRASSGTSDEAYEAHDSPAASWEDPFIPPYPEPTSEATPM